MVARSEEVGRGGQLWRLPPGNAAADGPAARCLRHRLGSLPREVIVLLACVNVRVARLFRYSSVTSRRHVELKRDGCQIAVYDVNLVVRRHLR